MKPTILLLLLSSTATAQTIYARNASGVYRSNFPGPWERVITFSDGDQWLELNGGDTPDDPPDDPPTDDDLAGTIRVISKELLKEKEARALSGVLRLFTRPDADLTKGEDALTRAVAVMAGSPFFPNNKFPAWLQRVKRLNPKYDRAFFLAADRGVSEAFGFEATEPITIVEIIQLVKLIFELLKELGIFSPQATAGLVLPSGLHPEKPIVTIPIPTKRYTSKVRR